jgi:DNA-3-methyladenine glycosylase
MLERELPELKHLQALPRSFYARDPRQVASGLLGKILVRDFGRTRRTGRIVEVEAYLGADDAAAHAAFGITERNRVLFGPPGHAYVYLSYGLHYCLNVSCMPEGDAGCVLFRALEPQGGLNAMARARGMKVSARSLADARIRKQLSSGPARLCQALEITRPRDNGRDMTSSKAGLWIADDGYEPASIVTAKRIGITKSADLRLRYYISGNIFVSRQ